MSRHGKRNNASKFFFDTVRLRVYGGRGGDGHWSFRHMGPNKKRPAGGHGGAGGDVIIRACPNKRDLRFSKFVWRAPDGSNGGKNGRLGKLGRHLELRVPVGTVVSRYEVPKQFEWGDYSSLDEVSKFVDSERLYEMIPADGSGEIQEGSVVEMGGFKGKVYGLDVGEFDDLDDEEINKMTATVNEDAQDFIQPEDEGLLAVDSVETLQEKGAIVNFDEEALARETDEAVRRALEQPEDNDIDLGAEVTGFGAERLGVGIGIDSDREVKLADLQEQGEVTGPGLEGLEVDSEEATPADQGESDDQEDDDEYDSLLDHEGYIDEDTFWNEEHKFGTEYDALAAARPKEENAIEEMEQVLADLDQPNMFCKVAEGGKPGRGNMDQVEQSHRFYSHESHQSKLKGKEGTLAILKLTLKQISDVGLVGFPNAGKSTLLASLSKTRPKIASYPFTTLHPSVGKVEFSDYEHITLADIPGLVEGAHENKGLGHEFLRHIERTRVLVYVIDCKLDSLVEDRDGASPREVDADTMVEYILNKYGLLVNELEQYEYGLSQKGALLVLNKMDSTITSDSLSPELVLNRIIERNTEGKHMALPVPRYCHLISAKYGKGLPQVAASMRKLVREDEEKKRTENIRYKDKLAQPSASLRFY